MYNWVFKVGVQGNAFVDLVEEGKEWVRVGEWDTGSGIYNVYYRSQGKWANYETYYSLMEALQEAEILYTEGDGDWV